MGSGYKPRILFLLLFHSPLLQDFFRTFFRALGYGESYYLTHMDEMMTIGSMYVWRASKGIYRFAPEIYEALISQPLTGNLPTDCL